MDSPWARPSDGRGEGEQAAFRAELVQLWSAHNTATVVGRTTVNAEYLEVVATRA